jgi:hypothetical protein
VSFNRQPQLGETKLSPRHLERLIETLGNAVEDEHPSVAAVLLALAGSMAANDEERLAAIAIQYSREVLAETEDSNDG